MLINANCRYNKTEILIEKYLELLKTTDSEKILVLVQNSKKKKEFLEEVKKRSKVGNIGNLKISSFYGLIYNFILENWALVENSIKDDKNPKIIPNMSGLEVSQFMFKNCIKEVDFSGYNSKTSLLHQLLRRYSLISLNSLSKEEIEKREKILQESYTKEVNLAINKYKALSIQKRAFDYIRQINIFEFLYKKVRNNFEYVFLDDGDEITPALVEYLKYIKKDVKEFFIAYDKMGSARLGSLGAINIDFEKFLKEKEESFGVSKDAKNIFNSIKKDEKITLENISSKMFIKRNEMIDETLKKIQDLIEKGIKPREIAIVTPVCDDFLKKKLESSDFKFNFISKSEKLNQNPLVSSIIDFLKILNDKNNSDFSYFKLRAILIEIFKIEKTQAIKLVQEYKIRREYQNENFFEILKEKEEFKFIFELSEKIKFEKLSLQLYEIASKFAPFQESRRKDIIKINQLLKQIYDFEEVFKDEVDNIELLTQLENTIISENPLGDEDILANEKENIIVSSAQKIIDYSYQTKFHFWLDGSSEAWLKQDIGPLYNAWVMQKTWNKKEFTLEDNIELTKDRTARMLYKLYLLADKIFLYTSSYDSLGQENFSGIDKFFEFLKDKEEKEEKKNFKPIVPRKDQQAVLDYKGGLMAVLATAGSGKTTIMLLLVEKILEGKIIGKIEPKNIFVLTFMESAARNFKERIKQKYPDLKELPNISTIHGLALRIIKENNNYSKLGLDFDFEIIDEIKRNAILTEILYSKGIQNDKLSLYDSAISAYKNELSIEGDDFSPSNRLFLSVFEEYQKELKKQNFLDYDDLLFMALKLLRENKDVLEYYQNLASIIIEDEAQDSSYVQQSLISLLGGKNKNIIRCGDINQAITSTFTNSDVAGFREFSKKATLVEMDRCQRCATGVLDCANNVVSWAQKTEFDPFSSLIMKPVENVNIVNKNAVSMMTFEKEKEEESFTIEKIKEILKTDKNSSIAILLRSNFAISKWDKILQENAIKTFKNSDSLINNPVFKVGLNILEHVLDPYDIKKTIELAKILYELDLLDQESYFWAKNLVEPMFLNPNYDIKFYWDISYFLFKNSSSIFDLAYEISSYYFKNTPQEPNIPLFCAIVQKIEKTSKSPEDTIKKLREIQYKNNFANIKFFNNEEDEKTKQNTVSIMTLHKSKGDEFDYVFIPELTQNNICFNSKEYELKENSKFIQKVKKHPKTDAELKKEIIEENFRLLYVGITRAKKELFLSSAKKYKVFFKEKDLKISELFEGLSYGK